MHLLALVTTKHLLAPKHQLAHLCAHTHTHRSTRLLPGADPTWPLLLILSIPISLLTTPLLLALFRAGLNGCAPTPLDLPLPPSSPTQNHSSHNQQCESPGHDLNEVSRSQGSAAATRAQGFRRGSGSGSGGGGALLPLSIPAVLGAAAAGGSSGGGGGSSAAPSRSLPAPQLLLPRLVAEPNGPPRYSRLPQSDPDLNVGQTGSHTAGTAVNMTLGVQSKGGGSGGKKGRGCLGRLIEKQLLGGSQGGRVALSALAFVAYSHGVWQGMHVLEVRGCVSACYCIVSSYACHLRTASYTSRRVCLNDWGRAIPGSTFVAQSVGIAPSSRNCLPCSFGLCSQAACGCCHSLFIIAKLNVLFVSTVYSHRKGHSYSVNHTTPCHRYRPLPPPAHLPFPNLRDLCAHHTINSSPFPHTTPLTHTPGHHRRHRPSLHPPQVPLTTPRCIPGPHGRSYCLHPCGRRVRLVQACRPPPGSSHGPTPGPPWALPPAIPPSGA